MAQGFPTGLPVQRDLSSMRPTTELTAPPIRSQDNEAKASGGCGRTTGWAADWDGVVALAFCSWFLPFCFLVFPFGFLITAYAKAYLCACSLTVEINLSLACT